MCAWNRNLAVKTSHAKSIYRSSQTNCWIRGSEGEVAVSWGVHLSVCTPVYDDSEEERTHADRLGFIHDSHVLSAPPNYVNVWTPTKINQQKKFKSSTRLCFSGCRLAAGYMPIWSMRQVPTLTHLLRVFVC